jgi:hypothetical protein
MTLPVIGISLSGDDKTSPRQCAQEMANYISLEWEQLHSPPSINLPDILQESNFERWFRCWQRIVASLQLVNNTRQKVSEESPAAWGVLLTLTWMRVTARITAVIRCQFSSALDPILRLRHGRDMPFGCSSMDLIERAMRGFWPSR